MISPTVDGSSGGAKPIGIIGVGLLGSELARRLIMGGANVLGFDVNPARLAEFAQMGGRSVVDAAGVFARCDRLILSLPSHEEVGTLVSEHAGALRAGHTIIDTTTGDPASSEALAAKLLERGVEYLDATVSGSSTQVRDGAAVMMVGGKRATFDSCGDIFSRLANTVFHTGPSGTGARMKLVTNLVLGLNRAVLAEGLAFAGALSLDPKLTLAIMRGSPAYSRVMDAKGEKMISGDFLPEARLSQHLKDVRLIVEAGIAAGLPMPLSQAHRDVLETAEAAGYGGLDNSVIIRVLGARQRNGLSA